MYVLSTRFAVNEVISYRSIEVLEVGTNLEAIILASAVMRYYMTGMASRAIIITATGI